MIEKLIALLTGGLTGGAGALVGLGQVVAILGVLGAAWIWIWERRDAVFMVVKVSDLAIVAAALAFACFVLWVAARGRPQ